MVVFAATPGVAADVPGARAAFLCAAVIATVALPVSLLVSGKKQVAEAPAAA
jgi:DHA2 family lincomycin resistance protein-like MFS transporter